MGRLDGKTMLVAAAAVSGLLYAAPLAAQAPTPGNPNLLDNSALALAQSTEGALVRVPIGDGDTNPPLGTSAEIADRWYVATTFNFGGTSLTPMTIAPGPQTLATQPGLGLATSQPIVILDMGAPLRQLQGTVTSYDNATGALSVDIPLAGVLGSGTASAWGVGPAPILTAQRVSAASPPGTPYSLQLTVTAGSTNTSHQSFVGFYQYLETSDIAGLDFGTPAAASLSLSMSVNSSVTGSFGISYQSVDGLRQFFHMCHVSANSWTDCGFPIPGDSYAGSTTCSGVTHPASAIWPTAGTGPGAVVAIVFEAGSDFQGVPDSWQCYAGADNTQTQLTTISGATVQVSRAKLEISPVATRWLDKGYATELAKAQRYFWKSYDLGTSVGTATIIGQIGFIGAAEVIPSGTFAGTSVQFPVKMRCDPTVTAYSPNDGRPGYLYDYASMRNVPVKINHSSESGFLWYGTPPSGSNAGFALQATADCRI